MKLQVRNVLGPLSDILPCVAAGAITSLIFADGPPPAQLFYLDFDTMVSGDASDHEYTAGEKEQIVGEMASHLAPLGMAVTPDLPHAPPYSTVFFNASTPGGSDGIDFRNDDKNDDAYINAKLMLGVVGFSPSEMTSEMIVRASINTAMHEVLHLVGARHQDAFTAPGTGISFSGLADNYDPPYPGPAMASLSYRTFGSLTLTFGLSAEKLLQDDMFVSPRSALKAILGSIPIAEQEGGNITPPEAQFLAPAIVPVPNTLPEDLDLPLPACVTPGDLAVIAKVVMVKGDLFDPPFNPPHYYKIPSDFPPGSLVYPLGHTVEVFSEVLEHRLSPIDTALYVLDSGPPDGPGFLPLDYYGESAINFDGIESGDPAIVDLHIPPFTTFIVEVAPSEFPDPVNGGQYELIVYAIGLIVPPMPPNPADLNHDCAVGVPDLLLLLAAWGRCPNDDDCPADLDGNGSVGVSDLLLLLQSWG